jgi:hypothetical protein
MFIELAGELSQAPEERNVGTFRSSGAWELLYARSINIPRLWRCRIREFASSIPNNRTPEAVAVSFSCPVQLFWTPSILSHFIGYPVEGQLLWKLATAFAPRRVPNW